jgi:ornithine cyclodeaminase
MVAPALIDDAEVARLLPPEAVLAAIARAFVDPPAAPPRIAAEVDDGNGRSRTLLAMPALRRDGIATIKLVTVRRGSGIGLSSHLLVLDRDGAPLALVEAHALTARRTAAASVLAAEALGVGGARTLAVFGAGRQARAQIEAFAAAMPIEEVRLWARRTDAAEALADFARAYVDTARVAGDPAEAVAGVDVVTCATGSTVPLVRSSAVMPGAHVDLVGGFRPDMREADDALIVRATVVADTAAALSEAGDLAQPIARGLLSPDRVVLLADLLARPRRRREGEVTLFKSVGHAAEDLVVTELLLERLGLAPVASAGGGPAKGRE